MTKKNKETTGQTASDLDLLENMKVQEEDKKPPKKHHPAQFLGKFLLYLIVIIVIAGVSFSYKVILSADSIITSPQKLSIFKQIKYIVTTPEKPITGEDQSRVNILLLGMGGAGHSGGYLADTIMIASIDTKTNQVGFLSIPRDLYVPIPGHGSRKINNAYAFGEMTSEDEGGGAALMTEVIENITGLKIHYWAAADFVGFRKIIDDMGGVDIEVERSFTDYQYPDYNYGYQVVSFTEGANHFDGETALQYARSRHGNSGEGSDFARSKRQQKIIFAVKEKALSVYTLINPATILSILNDLGDHVRTNLEPWEMVRTYKLAKNIEMDGIINQVLDNRADGVLTTIASPDGAYLLAPVKGVNDFSDIKRIARDIFETSPILSEDATIEIQNGTEIPGLASLAQAELESYNLEIVAIGNAAQPDFSQTIIYDFTSGEKPKTLTFLAEVFKAEVITFQPAYLYTTDSPEPSYNNLIGSQGVNLPQAGDQIDFLILIGQDFSTARDSSTSKEVSKTTI